MNICIKNSIVTIHQHSNQCREYPQKRASLSGSKSHSSTDAHVSEIRSGAEKIRQIILEEMKKAMNQAGGDCPTES